MPRLALLVFFGAACAAWGQTSTRDQQRAADLNYIATKLPTFDPFFFAQLKSADFNAAVSQLSAQIPTLTDAEFYVGLARLVAMAGDPHTVIQLTDASAVAIGFQQFPLTFRWLDDGVFVTAASAPYAQVLGMQLVAIGNLSIDDVLAELGTIIPHANSEWLQYRSEDYLRGQQILQGLDIVPAAATSPMTFRDRAGKEFTLQVGTAAAPMQAMPDPGQGPLPLYLQQSSANYWFTYSAPLRLLFIKYNACQDMPGYPFSAFAEDVLAAFDADPVDTLVIDFRGNGGGNSALINPLLDGLSQRLPAILANPNFRAFDVIDKGTFSSGVDDAMFIKSDALAAAAAGIAPAILGTVIGEPTGGAPSGPGNVQPFNLPGSNLLGQYSTTMIQSPAGIPPGPAFLPDIPVSTRSADYFARYDPVLGAILARWPGPAAAPSGDVIVVNGADFRSEEGIAAGSLAAAFGAFSAVPDGVQVNGQAGQVLAANASQVNFVVPAGAVPGTAVISIGAGGAEIARGQAAITAASPGIFVLDALDPAAPGAVLNQDNTINASANPAPNGSVIQIFATGCVTPVQVLIGETPADVLYSAPVPQLPGLWQINTQVPDGISGQTALFLIAGGAAGNGVTLWIK